MAKKGRGRGGPVTLDPAGNQKIMSTWIGYLTLSRGSVKSVRYISEALFRARTEIAVHIPLPYESLRVCLDSIMSQVYICRSLGEMLP